MVIPKKGGWGGTAYRQRVAAVRLESVEIQTVRGLYRTQIGLTTDQCMINVK